MARRGISTHPRRAAREVSTKSGVQARAPSTSTSRRRCLLRSDQNSNAYGIIGVIRLQSRWGSPFDREGSTLPRGSERLDSRSH